ncbi:MAG: FecR family protein [Leptospiraceae bacterium]|nr:FecR family protein [Leptospiraceae bacterium]
MKFDKDSKIILGILLFIILIFSILLYRNINSGAGGNSNPVIGNLTFKRKTIERKYDADVIWDKIESGIDIKNKDTIRTGDFSDAVLTLKDNTKININENSMIYLDFDEDNINLNFAYGSMSLQKAEGQEDKGTTLKIKAGDKTVEVKNSDLAMQKRNKEEVSFQVKEGTAKVSSGGKEQELKANESAKLSDEGIKVSKIAINLKTPEDLSAISEKAKLVPVNFSWTVDGEVKKTKLEIAYDSRFKNLSKSVNVSSNDATVNLESGNYYWRISSENPRNKEREFSPFRKFTVFSVSPPSIILPKNKQVFNYVTTPPIIEFNWRKLDTSRSYKLDLSTSANFTEIIKTISTSQTYAGIDKLTPGTYYARLTTDPVSKEIQPETSEIISFQIESKAIPDPPETISPNKDQPINKLVLKNTPFQWKDGSDFNGYTIQIAANSNFTNPILEKQVSVNLFKTDQKIEPGTYYWRVQATTRDGRKTNFSNPATLIIVDLEAIDLIAPANNATNSIEEEISFRWKKIPFAPKYQLEISSAADFSKIIHAVTSSKTQENFKFKEEGSYFWRVKLIGEDGSELLKSTSNNLEMTDVKEVVPIFPNKNDKIDMASKDQLEFKWEKNTKVTSFTIELVHDAKLKDDKLFTIQTDKNSYAFDDLDKLDEGNFIWYIQGTFNNKGKLEKGKRIAIPFKIYLSDKPEAPVIKTSKKLYVE